MLIPRATTLPLRDRVARCQFLQAGTVAALGLTLPRLLRAPAACPGPDSAAAPGWGRARRCILLFLTGGPPLRGLLG